MRNLVGVRQRNGWVAGLSCLLAIAGLSLLTAGPSAAGEQPECDLIAAPDGSDSGDGSPSDPLRSPQALVDALDFGVEGDPATGCFESGTYDSAPVTTIGSDDVRLTSLGQTARLVGSVRVADGADRVELDRVFLDGSTNPDVATLTVLGDDFTLAGSRVTERHVASGPNRASCVVIGTVQSPADRASITGNRIYDCGLRGSAADSGVSIYHSRGSLVLGNSISSSASRAISLYPSAIHTRVLNNDLFENGSALLFDSAVDDGSGPPSELDPTAENFVASNVIRGNGINADEEGNELAEYQVYGRSDTGGGNVLAYSCLFAPTGDGNLDVTGFLAAANTQNEPRASLCVNRYGPSGTSAEKPRCFELREGTELAETITAQGTRNDMLAGNGGPDTLDAGAGADCLYGGSDLDTLQGGPGADFIHGGESADAISGGAGNDLIDSRGDGAADRVGCGQGEDVVFADAADEVARNCERVR